MNINEELQMYRQMFSAEQYRQEAKQAGEDPFAPRQRSTISEQDIFSQNRTNVRKPMKEGQTHSMEEFASIAEKDPILGKNQKQMHEMVSKLRSIISDPSNPVGDIEGAEMLSNILSKMDADEMMSKGEK